MFKKCFLDFKNYIIDRNINIFFLRDVLSVIHIQVKSNFSNKKTLSVESETTLVEKLLKLAY